MVLERPRTIIVMAVNSAKTGQWKEITDSNVLRKEVGTNGFSGSPSSSSSSSASKTALSASSPAAAAAAAAKAAAAAAAKAASAAAAAVSTKASAKDDVFKIMMDSIHDNEQHSAASSKTVLSLPGIPRIKTAGTPKTGTGDAKGGKTKSGCPGSAGLSGGGKHDRFGSDDDERDSKKLKAAGDFSAARLYAKEQREKSAADLDHIIKLKEELEMEYVKALCTAYVDEMERDKIEARANGSAPSAAAAPYLGEYF